MEMDSEPISKRNDRSEITYGTTDENMTNSNSDPNGSLISNIMKGAFAVNHILIAGFSIYMLYVSFKSYYLFSWHPSLMTLGCFLLMAEAVMAIAPDNLLTSGMGRQAKIRTHWILQAVAAVCIFAGFLVIVINKNKSNSPHFTSNHGILGLVTVILVGLASTGGLTTLYAMKLRHIIKPLQMKLMHSILGIIAFVIGAACLVLGLYTRWFKSNGDAALITSVIIVILSTILTLLNAILGVFNRFKTLVTRP